MQKRKVVLFLVLIILLLTVYLFRYPLFLQFQYSRMHSLSSSRIWVHGVNSIDRYQFLRKKFSGFELDVIYTGPKGFAVLHPPAEAGTDTLWLDTFLSQTDPSDRLWLD